MTTDTIYTLTMQEIRALNAATLNVVVAKARGWKIERRDSKFGEFVIYHEWMFVRPDGSEFYPMVNENYLAQEFQACIPDVASDLNAALGLVTGLDWTLMPDRDLHYEGWEPTLIPGSYYAKVDVWRNGIQIEYEETHASPARALATAWCAWMKAEREREQ